MNTRIYYFSGTGNSLHTARSIASQLGGAEIISVRSDAQSVPADDAEVIGFVCPVYEWDIPGTNGGIKGLDDGHGGKCVTFTAIERVGSDVAVEFHAAEIGASVGASFGLICKDNLADTETFTLNAELTAIDATNVLGTLETQTNKTQLFVVGIGPAAE